MSVWYVSAADRRGNVLVAGPYLTHEAATDQVDFVRSVAVHQNARAAFMAWGTARSEEPMMTVMSREARRPYVETLHDFGGGHAYWSVLDALGRLLCQGQREYADALMNVPSPREDLFSYPAERVT